VFCEYSGQWFGILALPLQFFGRLSCLKIASIRIASPILPVYIAQGFIYGERASCRHQVTFGFLDTLKFLNDTSDSTKEHRSRTTFIHSRLPLGLWDRLSQWSTKAMSDNVDFIRREINLDRTKNGSPRMIPMNDAVMKAIQEFAKRATSTSRDAFVFPIKSPREWFLTALSKAKIDNYRWHDNRHTFCSRLAMRGENLKVIQQLAGHKTIQMSARYAHLGEKSLHAAVGGLCQ
jgi:hypothetical protein